MKKLFLLAFIACSVTSTRAAFFQYSVSLDGPSEGGTNTSPGIGFGTVGYDDAAHTLALSISFSGLLGGVTASHIHAATATPFTGTAGVATPTPTFPGFPSGVTSGSYSNFFDLTLSSSWNSSYITANGGTTAGAESAFASALAQGRAYWNIHSSTHPSGEIRGFVTPVPEPGTLALAGLGVVGLAARFWNKRRASKA